jgi:predicted ArsR family transcriptional regulator
VLSRHNFRRTYHGALAKLADPATAGLRPTAARVLNALREAGPLSVTQLAAQLSTQGRTASSATINRALGELAAAGVVAVDGSGPGGRWGLRPATRHPLLDAVDLRGAHDFRHTFSTWLEDAGIPARVIDEVMGHQATGRAGRHRGSAIGAYYRHTTPEMGRPCGRRDRGAPRDRGADGRSCPRQRSRRAKLGAPRQSPCGICWQIAGSGR